jgi:hypothetical protein
VRNEDPVSDFAIHDFLTNLNHLPGRLMPEHQWGFFETIPFKDIGTADSACHYPHQKFIRAYLRLGHLLQANIPVVVVHRDTHVILLKDWGA